VRPRASAPTPAPARPSRREEQPPDHRAERNRRLGAFFGLLAILGAIVAVSLVLLASDETRVQPVDTSDIEQQIDGLREFIRENSR
ncbi:MAG: hypothetical protein H0U84_00670, partial [Thermoleophilaceae bacterium]|nr:hypothetical protein [Thermoleophilaceae bacterium]